MLFKKMLIPLLLGFSPFFFFLIIDPSTATALPQVTQTNQIQTSQLLGTAPITKTAVITASKDAFIISGSFANNNAGRETAVTAGRTDIPDNRRGLIAFNIVGNIPQGSTILTTTLDLAVTLVPSGGGVNSTFGLHRITTDWEEGTKTGTSGSAATAGEVTWNSAKHLTTTWTTAGGDFTVTPSSNTAVTGIGPYTWNSTNNMVSNVQGWLDSPNSNYGWLLKSEDEITNKTARRFGSQEGGSPAILTVIYVPPPYSLYLPIITSNN